MTISVTTVSNNQTFGAWLSTTNRLANLMSQNTVTADSSSGGSVTTGNAYVNGYFGASYLYAGSALIGGNVSSNGALTIVPNVSFTYSSANLVAVTANSIQTTFTVSVNNVNITSNTISITGNVSFANTPVFGGNVSVNGYITVGNSSVNAVINSTAVTISNSSVSYSFASPNTSQYSGNSFFLNANGQWSQVVTSPSGSNTQVQFNNSGSFGATSAMTFDSTSNTFTATNVKVAGALLDNSNRTLIVKDSSNTVVWGA